MEPPAICTNCRSDDRWILHHFHRRSTYHRLCTACLLKLNTKSFCPICFSLHDRPKLTAAATVARGTLVCIRCSSLSHASCVAPNAPKSPFLCTTCSNPNLSLFDFRKSGEAPGQAIDLKSSRAFLAAATIAADSLEEAAERARIEIERKSKEAVLAKKKAKEALEKVALMWMREQERMKLGDAAEASVSMDYSMSDVSNNGGQAGVLGASRSL